MIWRWDVKLWILFFTSNESLLIHYSFKTKKQAKLEVTAEEVEAHQLADVFYTQASRGNLTLDNRTEV